MHTATREETRFIQRVIILFIVPLLICIFVSLKLSGRNEKVHDAIDEITKHIESGFEQYGILPIVKDVTKERGQVETMEAHFNRICTHTTMAPIAPPEDVVEKGVYFKKQLYLAHKGIKALATERNVSIPDAIGFSEALPSDKEVRLLLRKLETVSTVLTNIIRENIEAITVIKILDDVNVIGDDASGSPITEVLIRIDINCAKSSLVNILYKAGTLKPFIVVKDIGVKNIKEGLLQASFVFSRLVTEK